MAFRFRRRLRRNTDGTIDVRLSDGERAQLRSLADGLRSMLDDPTDGALRRLFPPCFPDDAVREAAYQMVMGDELRQAHLTAVQTLGDSAELQKLEPDQATAWLQAINSARLVLGTQLDITDDTGPVVLGRNDPNLDRWLAYEFLSLLLNDLVDSLSF